MALLMLSTGLKLIATTCLARALLITTAALDIESFLDPIEGCGWYNQDIDLERNVLTDREPYVLSARPGFALTCRCSSDIPAPMSYAHPPTKCTVLAPITSLACRMFRQDALGALRRGRQTSRQCQKEGARQ